MSSKIKMIDDKMKIIELPNGHIINMSRVTRVRSVDNDTIRFNLVGVGNDPSINYSANELKYNNSSDFMTELNKTLSGANKPFLPNLPF